MSLVQQAAMRKLPVVVAPALAELVKAAFDFNYRQRLIATAVRRALSLRGESEGFRCRAFKWIEDETIALHDIGM